MLKKILSIGQYPYLKQEDDESFIDKTATLFKAYGLVWLAIIFIAAPLIPLADNIVTHTLHFKSIMGQDKISMKQMLQKTGYAFGLMYICLLGPLLEETVFRLPLSFRKIHIAISLAVVMLFIATLYHLPKTSGLGLRIPLCFLQLVVIPACTFFLIRKFLPAEIKLSDNVKKWLIITSMCLFGLMHVANYSPLQWPIIWIYPVYVLPQFLMGWLMTYVRLKNGFIWGVALHCLINTTGMLFSFSSLQQTVKPQPVHTIPAHSKKDTSIKHQSK
jgi:Type II CAAX prenyl endopeptidase Rce1-like